MSKKQFNALANFSTGGNINVDRENGILKNVEIAKFGLNKNGSYFNNQFLTDLVKSGNNKKNGVKSRFGHPNMCATSLGTFIGRYKDFELKNEKVYANLTLDPITKKTQVEGKGISMFDYIMDMAESNPDMFGNSIVVFCSWFDEEITNEAGEKEMVESLILQDFIASDLVDDPAATDELFSANPNDLGIILTTFLDQNPQIFSVISEKPEMISDFFDRYFNYLNRKGKPLINVNMSFLDKLKKKFGKPQTNEDFNVDVTLADGSIVTVVTTEPERDTPAVGDSIVDSEGNSVGEGEHLLPDGSTILTDADGVITEINDAPEGGGEGGGNDGEPTNQEIMNSVQNLTKSFNAFKKSYETTQKENEQAFDYLGGRIQQMGKNIKSNYTPPQGNGGKRNNSTTPTGGYDPDKVREEREKRRTNK